MSALLELKPVFEIHALPPEVLLERQKHDDLQADKTDKVETITLERVYDPFLAATRKIEEELLRSLEPMRALKLLQDMRDHGTFDGQKIKLDPAQRRDVEYRMGNLITQLNPHDPNDPEYLARQAAMRAQFGLAPLVTPTLTPAPTGPALAPAAAPSFAAPAPTPSSSSF